MTQFLGNYIDNQWQLPKNPTNHFTRHAPGDQNQVTLELQWNKNDVDQAIACAKNAFHSWKRTPLEQRIEYLKKLQTEFKNEAENLAKAIAIESGKPLWEAKTEVNALIGKIDIMTSIGLEETATVRPTLLPNGRYIYRPLGVVAVIAPFNFPVHLANGHIVPALLAGNCVVVKPSIMTAKSMQIYFKCIEAAAFPPGVINLVHGDGDVGQKLVSHNDVQGVLFTGSYKVGTAIGRATIDTPGKLVALELGGKNTSIVLPDANLKQAATEIFQAAFLTTGQRCSATSRIILHHDIADDLITQLTSLIERITIGDPLKDDPFMGPLVTQAAYKAFCDIQNDNEDGKLTPIIRGGKYQANGLNGHYVTPGLWRVNQIDRHGRHQSEEIFGPDIVIYTFSKESEAISIANATNYGLAMSIFTADQDRFENLAIDLETGILNLNRSTVGASGRLPFGGVKNSGNHRPSAVHAGRYCAYPQAQLLNDAVFDEKVFEQGPLSKLKP